MTGFHLGSNQTHSGVNFISLITRLGKELFGPCIKRLRGPGIENPCQAVSFRKDLRGISGVGNPEGFAASTELW